MSEIIVIICASLILLLMLFMLIVGSKIIRYILYDLYDIKTILYDKYVKFDPSIDRLISLANDVWRLKSRLEQIKPTLSPENQKRLDSSMRRLENYLTESDIMITDLVGQAYNDGMNVEVVSVEHDADQARPIIKETVAPMVAYKGIIRQRSQIVILSNAKEGADADHREAADSERKEGTDDNE